MSASRPSSSADDPTTFEISEDLVQSRTPQAASATRLDIDDVHLTVAENLANGNGGRIWEAGMILAKYLLRRRRRELEGSTIVELGAGGGIVSLAIGAGCNTAAVHVTDMQQMLSLLEQNIALNGLQGKVRASVYDWGNSCPEGIPKPPDVVLAADCVYFEPAFEPLQKTMQDLIGPATVCYFCFKRRRRADMHFLKAVKKMFVVEDITDDPDRERYARENIFLLMIRRKPV